LWRTIDAITLIHVKLRITRKEVSTRKIAAGVSGGGGEPDLFLTDERKMLGFVAAEGYIHVFACSICFSAPAA
jgi:hypothetical protein